MSKIIEKYNYNVAKYKTDVTKPLKLGGRGGICLKECHDCVAYEKGYCNSCKGTCPDLFCKSDRCKSCVNICYRHPKAKNHLEKIKGKEDIIERRQQRLQQKKRFIPAINKLFYRKYKKEYNLESVSIPYYAIFDFEKGKLKCTDIKEYFGIVDATKVFINFYMKDDKIFYIYDQIISGDFWKIIAKVKGVDYWFSPCFSVYSESNSFDQILNFKRQFWIGDLMQDYGLNVIQEALYSENKNNITGLEYLIKKINNKKIKAISQCFQLTGNDVQFSDIFLGLRELLKKVSDIDIIITGLGEKRMEACNQLSNSNTKIFFSNYTHIYREKKYDEYMKNIESINNNLIN